MGNEKVYFDGEEMEGTPTPLWSTAEAEELRQRMKDVGLYPTPCATTPHKSQIDAIIDELSEEEIMMLREELELRRLIFLH